MSGVKVRNISCLQFWDKWCPSPINMIDIRIHYMLLKECTNLVNQSCVFPFAGDQWRFPKNLKKQSCRNLWCQQYYNIPFPYIYIYYRPCGGMVCLLAHGSLLLSFSQTANCMVELQDGRGAGHGNPMPEIHATTVFGDEECKNIHIIHW